MKYLILIILAFCIHNFLKAQINLDSMIVFGDTTNIDSVRFIGTSSDQEIDNIIYAPSNDVCGTLFFTLSFKGCGPVHTTFFDTTISLGMRAKRIIAYTEWDTLASCPMPTQKIVTDTSEWSRCGLTGIDSKNLLEKNINIYPNPVRQNLRIEKVNDFRIDKLYLTDLLGKMVLQFDRKETNIDVSSLSNGSYLLHFVCEEGRFAKKVVVE